MNKKMGKKGKTIVLILGVVIAIFFIVVISFILKSSTKSDTDYAAAITIFASVLGGLLTLVGVILTINYYRAKDKADKYSDLLFEHDVKLVRFKTPCLLELISGKNCSCDFFVIGKDEDECSGHYLRMDLFFTVCNYAINSLSINEISFNKTGLQEWTVIKDLRVLNVPSANLVQISSADGCQKYRLGLVFQGLDLSNDIIKLINNNNCVLELKLDTHSMVGTSIGIYYEINFKKPVQIKKNFKKQNLQIENICKKYLQQR